MDKLISHCSAFFERAVSWRVPKLQHALESGRLRASGFAKLLEQKFAVKQTNTLNIRKLRAILLFLASVAFGVMAYNICSEEVSLEWQKHHFPSEIIWRTAFVSEGLKTFEAGKELKQRKRFAQVLKGLPSRVESGNQIWEGENATDPSWWAVFQADSQRDPLLFCLKCDSPPKSWQPAGSGWTAFDSVMAVARAQAHSYKPAAQSKAKRVVFLDPYEIRY